MSEISVTYSSALQTVGVKLMFELHTDFVELKLISLTRLNQALSLGNNVSGNQIPGIPEFF